MLTKIVHPADVKMYNGRHYPMFCKITIDDKGRLSITGVIGPNKFGNAKGGCGQIDMEFAHRNPAHNDKRYRDPTTLDDLRLSKGWDVDKWYTLLEVWHDWHLNDMSAACEHQRALGWTYEQHRGVWHEVEIPSPEIDEYATGETEYKPVFNPYEGEACPVCGYSIGSKWLKEELPAEVIAFVESLPDTDRVPNWV